MPCHFYKVEIFYNLSALHKTTKIFIFRTGIRCTPLNVVVKRRVDLLADVNDDGFNPKIIYIDQGHSIKWQWKQCTVPHSVQEVKYVIDRSCFKKDAENAA